MFDKRFPGVKKYTIIDDEGNVWDVVKTKEFWNKCNSNEKIKEVVEIINKESGYASNPLFDRLLKMLNIK